MVLGVAGDGDPPAVGADLRGLGDGLRRVVGALHLHVGPERADDRHDVLRLEQDDVVHAAERRDDLGALGRGDDGPSGPLVCKRAEDVAVHRHDEEVALPARALEVAQVADVEQVEQAVRERDGGPGGESPRGAAAGRRW